jgi:hypothetical protein
MGGMVMTLGWILLLGFGVLNLWVLYRWLAPRRQLGWLGLPGAAWGASLLLFGLWPNPLALISFPLLQSLAFWLLFHRLGQDAWEDPHSRSK